MKLSLLVASAGGALLLALAGCEASTNSATNTADNTACSPVPTVADAGAATPVSLRNDVMPILGFSCNFSSCHGSERPGRVYLGPRKGDPDPDPSATASKVRGILLGPSARADMTMVLPSRPDESFLMYKLDGDFCAVAARCGSNGCGEAMPKGSGLLDATKRDTFRRWIAEGAADN